MKTSAMVITKLWKTSCFSKKAAAAVTLIARFVSKKPTKLSKELSFGLIVRLDFTNLQCYHF